MIRTLLLITLFTGTACSPENAPDQQDDLDMSQQLIEVLAGMPNGTIMASTAFNAGDVELEYTMQGVTATQPLTGTATISLTKVDDTVVLSGFDALVDDFVIEVGLSDPTFPSSNVNVSNVAITLADAKNDGSVIKPPEVDIDPIGTATTSPFLLGQAHFASALGAVDFTTIEELSAPVVAVFAITDQEIQLSVDYEYAMNVELFVTIPITLRVHYDVVVPLL